MAMIMIGSSPAGVEFKQKLFMFTKKMMVSR